MKYSDGAAELLLQINWGTQCIATVANFVNLPPIDLKFRVKKITRQTKDGGKLVYFRDIGY